MIFIAFLCIIIDISFTLENSGSLTKKCANSMILQIKLEYAKILNSSLHSYQFKCLIFYSNIQSKWKLTQIRPNL